MPQGSADNQIARRVRVEGIVQGVGFRPFVHRLARELGLSGAARNFTGGLEVEVEGPAGAVQRFMERLPAEAPPIAVIERVEAEPIEPRGREGFNIAPSREQEGGPVFVSPDVAICPDCRRELADPRDRRYRHPFINCTNCGPRFTIIEGVPYDRPRTSMAPFEMCEDCGREYRDIGDRRYHAQPVACPACGPTLSFVSGERTERGDAALKAAREMLLGGRVVAVKGLGGFHLACDADNEHAVQVLRERKMREAKPLAVMAPDLDTARRFADITDQAAALMTSPQSPIVLVDKRLEAALAHSVAPDAATYGVMLAYTPLHILLLQDLPIRALVMTSGNVADEPLCIDNDEAMRRLGEIADGFLLHDRDIYIGCDDSVVRLTARGPIIFRRARGYVPFPVRLAEELPPLLAVGGHLKNTFCITSGRNAFLSQHIGDLADIPALEFYKRSLEHFESLLQVTPQAVACDLHPDYLSTRVAERIASDRDLPLFRVQHHHAHLAACLADNHEPGPAIGLLCDGTGYGGDGTVWGCEVLVGDAGGFERFAHLRQVPLPGGEAAIDEPWRMALVYSMAALGPEFVDMVQRSGHPRRRVILEMIERGINCPMASSAGRLFDAVAALLDLHTMADYEGQAPMHLEAIAVRGEPAYRFEITRAEDGWVLDPTLTIRGILEDINALVDRGRIAGRFHSAFVMMLAEIAAIAARERGLDPVALSGGTFQNRIVVEDLMDELERRGLRPLMHRSLPPGDGCLALGQAMVAHARWT
ncbi:MAG TPA: carbamoyltransferase HypF [Armatimonadota bacterium]|nr:carbamoyltransferase HypF [Armatimonadota bacterium]